MKKIRGARTTYVGSGVFSTASRDITIVRMHNQKGEIRYFLYTDWMSQAGDTRLGPEEGFGSLDEAKKYITKHNLRGMSRGDWQYRKKIGAVGEYDETHKIQRGEEEGDVPLLRSLGMTGPPDDNETFD